MSTVSVGLAFGMALAPSTPVLAAATSAHAIGPEGDPEELSAQAVERFQAKDYDGAVSLFQQAYAIDPQPNYLFNIGRVYEEKGDLENAVVYYQKFVGQSGVDLESRQAATERLKVLREALAQLESNKEPEPKDVGPEQPKDDTVEPVPDEQDQPPVVDEEAQQAAKRKKTLRITGYALMGVGGAALVVGGVLGGLASSNVADANADEFVDRTLAFRDKARRQAAGADAMFITGGVLAVTGVALVLATLGGKKSKKAGGDVARRTAWSPVVGPERVGVGLTHRF
ncbi:tetratricopeptide repeat protein [Paraliomyxa miuraensis]|uniref:tetratricopeptide repeat protein n=1 Tax=Paraliomyxa miuraensis TaxID=376150 RepID=UPI00225BC5B4|nr:tetratricopeptide repeat protein [Paraliomyxa miuraensis]MCX4242065.1 tetratricopeptide repeat protein [Paraliomyxa miuraensis]